LSPGEAWTGQYKVVIEWIFCGDETGIPDATTSNPEDVRTPIGVDTPPGSGGSSGGIESWDHDNDPSTPPKTLVPGIDSLFESPDGNNVFDHSTFVPDGINPDDITSISVEQLNPCAAADCTTEELTPCAASICTAEEIAAGNGKDNIPDIVILTKPGEPSYTILSDPNNPGTQPPKAIGSEEHDDRDVEVADINGDGVPDLIVVSYDAPNRVYYGDPTRPGDYSSTMHDTFGLPGDGSIGVEVVDLDNDATTPPDIVVANENALDQLYLSPVSPTAPTGAGTGLFDERYEEFTIPGTTGTGSTTTDVAVEKGLGADATTSFIAVFTNSDGVDQIMELSGTTKTSLLDGSSTLSGADVLSLDSSLSAENTQSVEVSDVTGDGIADVVVIFKDSPNGVAGYVYPGSANTPLTADVFTVSEIPIGSSAVSGVEMTIEGSTIQIIDENGGVHHFERGSGGNWPSAIYPDPNLPEGATSGATKPHDHQDAAGVVETADWDGDGYADIVSGNQILLSSLAVTKGDFSDVTPSNFDHSSAPLSVVALDADSDTDSDLFVIPGDGVPYIILNRGDGDLKHSEKAVLSGLTPPSGSWSDTSIEKMTKYTHNGVDKLVISFDDATTEMMVIPIPGGGSKADWESITAGDMTTIPSTATKQTKQIMAVDLDGGGQELLHLHDSGLDIMKTTDGTTWTIEKTIALSGATSFDVGHLDTSGTTGARRGLDIVVAANDNVHTYYAPDFPVATGDPAPALADWGTELATITQSDAASSTLEKVLIFDEDQNGIDDILVTTDAGERYLYRVTEDAAEQRHLFLVQNNPTDLTLSDETESIIAILKVDANLDGAIDIIFAYEDGRTKLILAEVAARTDLGPLGQLADPTTGIVAHLADMMNPTVAPPSELFCRENPGDATCIASVDGAWVNTNSSVGGDVSTWGNGNILTGASDQTITVEAPVDPATLPEHGPPCALPGSQVVPVRTEFYIEFPVVNLLASSNPTCLATIPYNP